MTDGRQIDVILSLDSNGDGFISFKEFLQLAKVPVIPVPRIFDISHDGFVMIEWNTEMSEKSFEANSAGRTLNQTYVGLKIETIRLDDPSKREVSLQQAKITYLKGRLMQLQIMFDNPTSISSFGHKDHLQISFTNSSIFRSVNNVEMGNLI
jgi:hypothetical protein